MSRKKQAKQRQRADWRKVMQRWRKSGLSVRQFCRRHKIPETSFYQGRRRLANSFSRSRRKPLPEPFVEVKLESSPIGSAPLEIVWAQPPVVKVYAGCGARLLEQTIRFLKEQGC